MSYREEQLQVKQIRFRMTHPPPSRLVKNWVDPPPKNKQGIGTSTYMRAARTTKIFISTLQCNPDIGSIPTNSNFIHLITLATSCCRGHKPATQIETKIMTIPSSYDKYVFPPIPLANTSMNLKAFLIRHKYEKYSKYQI